MNVKKKEKYANQVKKIASLLKIVVKSFIEEKKLNMNLMLTTEGPGSSNCTVSTGTLPTSNGSEDDDCGLADAGTPSVPEKR